jgi:uncharacterized protein involved in exopolysaccharide biosynthesis
LAAKLFLSRLLETFFRRKWLYLLPLVPFVAFGVATVLGTPTTYRSTGVVQIPRNTLLNELSDRGGENFGPDTPAAFTTRGLSGVLLTDKFIERLIANAGLTSAVQEGTISPDDIRSSISATAGADEFVAISAYNGDPEVAYALAGSAIRSYIDWQIDNNAAQATAAKQQLETELKGLEEGQRSAGAELEISRVRGQLQVAENTLNDVTTSAEQQFQVVDDPQPPSAPEPRRKQDVITLAMFTILGLLVSGAALVVGTLLDRSVRYSDEIEAHLHLPVLATVPDDRGSLAPRVL